MQEGFNVNRRRLCGAHLQGATFAELTPAFCISFLS
ncbi:hypothetical protein SAMN05444161_7534 [Rhizobiales bacterium GAS191]|nr:hypothetical protein SAMN05444161_7534 [Rhizobiales bacterium GAS191]